MKNRQGDAELDVIQLNLVNAVLPLVPGCS